ncbi:hypothetical protein [Desulfogranum marinum]|uniref:hypothetical protein n=1 Tax=Desulfogranum marinum TaxID=453220 RepID=UPI001964DDC3|nr:hypothetical protein [Desulfogranum marinum]MBM9513744.1 hypothetical protein [Desulfogranum marinum]
MARHINPSNSTNKTIDAIDRKRDRERLFLLKKARENSSELSVALVQRLLDQHIIETNDVSAIQESLEKQLRAMGDLEEFEMRYKIAPIRNLTQDPNIASLFITQFIIENLIDHPNIQDIFGDDLEVYRTVDSILSAIRPR